MLHGTSRVLMKAALSWAAFL